METHNVIAHEMRMGMAGESNNKGMINVHFLETMVVPVSREEECGSCGGGAGGPQKEVGSGVYFNNRELPMPKNCCPSRKRRRGVPVQGLAMLPAPVLYNGFSDAQATKRRCVSPLVATTTSPACQVINHKDPLRVIEDLRFTEAALTLTALCGKKLYHPPKIETDTAEMIETLVQPRPVMMNRSLKGIKPDP